MKIYTANIEVTQPANKAVHAPLNSKYGIGLQFTENGVPKTLAEDEVKMDGQTADNIIDDKIFVFNRESGMDENVIVHDVAVGSPAIQVSDNQVKSATLSNRLRLYTTTVSLSNLIDKPTELTYDQLLLYTRSTKDMPIEDEEYECVNYNSSTSVYIDTTGAGGTRVYLRSDQRKFAISGSSEWIFYDKMTFSPSAKAGYNINTKGSGTLYLDLKVEIKVPSTITHYTVTENQEEQGKAIGYNEVPILSSITLAGTLEDDTPFSYTLPTT